MFPTECEGGGLSFTHFLLKYPKSERLTYFFIVALLLVP